jgi:hypothetical protein
MEKAGVIYTDFETRNLLRWNESVDPMPALTASILSEACATTAQTITWLLGFLCSEPARRHQYGRGLE